MGIQANGALATQSERIQQNQCGTCDAGYCMTVYNTCIECAGECETVGLQIVAPPTINYLTNFMYF